MLCKLEISFYFLPVLVYHLAEKFNLIYYSAIVQRVEEIIRLRLGERENGDGMVKEEMMVFAHFQWCGARDGKIVATPASTIFIRDARGFRLRFG